MISFELARDFAHHSLINVCRRWEIVRVTAHVDLVFRLIHSNPIDSHCRWEDEMFEIDVTKVFR